MQIRKTYRDVSPQLLYDGIRDFIVKQGLVLGESKLKTYSVSGNSSAFIYSGRLSFNVSAKSGAKGNEGVIVHIVGSDRAETKVMFDIDDALFPREKVAAFTDDLEFIFGVYEIKSG